MIEVIKDKCTGCGKCTIVCPSNVLKVHEGKAEVQEGRFCMKCIHCAAVCKAEAITFNGEKATVSEANRISEEDFAETLKTHIVNRRSYRNFEERPVDRNVIKEVLESTAWAPSAKNQHKIGYIVVDNKKVIDGIMNEIIAFVKETGISKEILGGLAEDKNIVMGNAPTLVLVHGNSKAINPTADTAIAMTTAELLFQSQGIGTCWAGYLARMSNGIEGIKKLLPEIPENHIFYGAFMMGYPQNEEYYFIPQRFRKPQIDFV